MLVVVKAELAKDMPFPLLKITLFYIVQLCKKLQVFVNNQVWEKRVVLWRLAYYLFQANIKPVHFSRNIALFRLFLANQRFDKC